VPNNLSFASYPSRHVKHVKMNVLNMIMYIKIFIGNKFPKIFGAESAGIIVQAGRGDIV
jgi:hypothetical protein